MEVVNSFQSSLLICCRQIRGAIQEYQTQVIDSVKEDIKHLHEKVSSLTIRNLSRTQNDLPLVQNAILIFRGLPHAQMRGLPSNAGDYLGSPNRATTLNIHETHLRRSRSRLGTLCQRTETPVKRSLKT